MTVLIPLHAAYFRSDRRAPEARDNRANEAAGATSRDSPMP